MLFLLTIMPVSGSRAAEAVFDIDIPAMNAAEALNRLAEQTGSVMLFSYDLARARQANAVRGRYTLLDGLELLLRNTGLSGGISDKRVVVIARNGNEPAGKGETVRKRGLFASIVAMLAGSQAVDVKADQATEGEATPTRLSEIVVTAQKREERLQDVPISLTVLSTDEIQRRGLVSRQDYMRSMPSVLLRDDGPGLSEIVFRGAYGDGFRTGPTVALYFADVPLTGYAIGSSTDIKLIDIARVEVLRGPQGTLYGSNALSGAVRYIPAAPDLQNVSVQTNIGYSHTGGSGGNNTVIEAIANFPVVEDKLAVRAVAFQHRNEGYVRNVAGDDPELQAAAAMFGAENLAVNKNHVGSTEYLGGRLMALWRPTTQLSFTLTYFNQKDSQDDRLFELRDVGPFQLSDYQFGDIIGGNDDALRVDMELLNLTGEYDVGWGTLYSSTAWMDQEFVRKWGIGILLGSPVRPIPQISTTKAEVFVQELRLASKFSGPLQLVAGLYYEDSEQPTSQPTFFGGDPAANPFQAVKLWDGTLDRLVRQKAAFGELSYAVNEKVQLRLGGRYFEYDSEFSSIIFDSVLIPESNSTTESEESGNTLKAGVDFQPTENALIYAAWSQGFRLGRPLSTELIRNLCDLDSDGFLDGTDISSFLNRVDSDQLDSYELGAKLSLLGGRMTLSSAVFQNDWADIPIAVTPPGCLTSTTINGGTARARGFETEGSVRLYDAWQVNFGFGYVDSELTSNSSLGERGDRLNFTPEFNGSLGVEYGFSVAGHDAFIRGDYLYFGSYYTQTGERGERADSYGLVNLRSGVMLSGQFDLQFYIDNATNSDAFTSILGPAGFPPGYAVRLRPRTVGVGLNYRF